MTSPPRRNFLVRLWLGFWRGLTAFRMAVFNVLFLLLLALAIRALLPSGAQQVLSGETTLVLQPTGVLVEQFTTTPVERAFNEAMGEPVVETRLRDLLRALDLAAEDDRIAQVLVVPDSLLGVPPGSLTELAAAMDRFRGSGKPVIAYAGGFTQSTYGLTALADEVWLHPDGFGLIEGYAYFRNYFREALETLRVDVNLFKVGEFKSAMEPFTRDSMSEVDREAAEYFLGGLWQAFLDRVSDQRGMPVELLAQRIEEFVERMESSDGDMARALMDAGLVDRLMTGPEARAELARRGDSDSFGGFRQIGMLDYLALSRDLPSMAPQVAILVAEGAILGGDQPPGSIGAETLSRQLRQVARDDSIKALVLRIDSGGGSAFASERIRNEMLALRDAGKPVVVSMSNVAASGAYWMAMGADEVWAYPTTITGSIGVFGILPTFQDSLDGLGIHTDGFGLTPLAGGFRPDRALPESARRLVQSSVEHVYREFIELVSEYRGLSVSEVDRVAQGRVWTGVQALQRGLVDQLGTLDQAVAAAARIAGLGDDYQSTYVAIPGSPLEQWLAGLGGRALAATGVRSGWSDLAVLPLPRSLREQVVTVMRALRTRPGQPGILAHCLCEAPR